MVEIKQMNYINCEDIFELTGHKWSEMPFTECAENDSFVMLHCDDESLEELYEDLEDELRKDGLILEDIKTMSHQEYHPNYHRVFCLACGLRAQIELVEALREKFNITDTILVWISW